MALFDCRETVTAIGWSLMGYPQHWLLSWGGTLYSGSDIWVNTLRMATPEGTPAGIVDEAALVTDFADDIQTHFTNTNSGYSSFDRLEWVKFNEIDPLGRYVDQENSHVHEYPTPVAGVSSSTYPPQVALVVSWTTEAARGYASKGRIFVPVPKTISLTGLGSATTATMQPIATQWAAFLSTINNMPGLDLTDLVASVVSKIPAEGKRRPITGVRIGTVLDTQRRRRNAIPEVYAAAALP